MRDCRQLVQQFICSKQVAALSLTAPAIYADSLFAEWGRGKGHFLDQSFIDESLGAVMCVDKESLGDFHEMNECAPDCKL